MAKKKPPVHYLREVVMYGRQRIACSWFSERATLPSTDDWSKVTCKHCLKKKPK